MTLGPSLTRTGILGVIMIFLAFGLWFCLTCAILIAMEGCSAMVSSLRMPRPKSLMLTTVVTFPTSSMGRGTVKVCRVCRPHVHSLFFYYHVGGGRRVSWVYGLIVVDNGVVYE